MEKDPNEEPGLFDNFQETQKEVLEIELVKTRNKLFTIAGVFFIFDVISLSMLNLLTTQAFLYILILPAIMVGLAFLALKEPMLAMIIASVIVLALWIYTISILGARGAITGWLGKAIVIAILLGGFQSAREAQKIKKELKA